MLSLYVICIETDLFKKIYVSYTYLYLVHHIILLKIYNLFCVLKELSSFIKKYGKQHNG